MNMLRYLTAQVFLVLAQVCTAAIVTVEPGDTLSIDFELVSPRQSIDSLALSLRTIGNKAVSNSHTRLYDESRFLGQSIISFPSQPGYVAAGFASLGTDQLFPASPQFPKVDLSRFNGPGAKGKVEIEVGSAFSFDTDSNFYFSKFNDGGIYTGACTGFGCGANDRHRILAASLGGRVIYEQSTSLESFSFRAAANPNGISAASYLYAFDGETFTAKVQLGLIGNSADPQLISTWRDGIEQAWSYKYFIEYAGVPYPLVFDIDMSYGMSQPDMTIVVHNRTSHFVAGDNPRCRLIDSSSGRLIGCEFYTGLVLPDVSSGTLYDFNYLQGSVAAHEFGHMLGLLDEYGLTCSGVIRPGDGLMGCWGIDEIGRSFGLPVQERYFTDFLQDARNFTGLNLVGGMAPVPLLRGTKVILGDADGDAFSVPEPGSLLLIVTALLILLLVSERCPHRSKSASSRVRQETWTG